MPTLSGSARCSELIDALDSHEARFTAMITKRLDAHRGYQAIQQVPGIGPVLAAVFVAEIGDVQRFTSPAHLCSWLGLTPRHRESSTVCAPRPHHQAGLQTGPLGSHRGDTASPDAQPRSPPTRTALKLAAARTSPRLPRHANCSHWSTTGCATGTSARSTGPGQRDRLRAQHVRGRSHVRPPVGVVAILIDPACCYRTAPCPHRWAKG